MHISEYVRKLLTIWIQIKQGLPYFNKLLEYLVYVKRATLPFKKCKFLGIAVLLGSLLLMPEF